MSIVKCHVCSSSLTHLSAASSRFLQDNIRNSPLGFDRLGRHWWFFPVVSQVPSALVREVAVGKMESETTLSEEIKDEGKGETTGQEKEVVPASDEEKGDSLMESGNMEDQRVLEETFDDDPSVADLSEDGGEQGIDKNDDGATEETRQRDGQDMDHEDEATLAFIESLSTSPLLVVHPTSGLISAVHSRKVISRLC